MGKIDDIVSGSDVVAKYIWGFPSYGDVCSDDGFRCLPDAFLRRVLLGVVRKAFLHVAHIV